MSVHSAARGSRKVLDEVSRQYRVGYCHAISADKWLGHTIGGTKSPRRSFRCGPQRGENHNKAPWNTSTYQPLFIGSLPQHDVIKNAQDIHKIRSSRRFSTEHGQISHASGIHNYDVVIVGGGVVGLALACALASSSSFSSSRASIALIEAASLERLRSWASVKQANGLIDDWENRVISLTEENKAWLNAIGVTDYLVSSRICAVNGMHVTDGLTGAALDFDAPNVGGSGRLGSMVEISNLQQAMLKRLEAVYGSCKVDILEGYNVDSIVPNTAENTSSLPRQSAADSKPLLRLTGSADVRRLQARLLVGADGYNSPVRKYAGINAHGWEYGRLGVVATMACQPSLPIQGDQPEHIAYQRFLPTGTIACLPLSENYNSLVWALPPETAKSIIKVQKDHDAAGNAEPSPITYLITAAFRLPWTALQPILQRLSANGGSDVHEWLIPLIEEELMTYSSGELTSDVPSPVVQIQKQSVAAFPLKLSHAESYLGSSLRQTTFAEAGAAALTPSKLLSKAIDTVSSLTGAHETSHEQPEQHNGRTVLIGDAAHTMHPLAGQGLNLGLADAQSLAKALNSAVEVGADLGSHISLQDYPRERYLVNQAMLSAVDHLHWLFVSPSAQGQPADTLLGEAVSQAAIWGRSTGFEVINEMGWVKQAFMGFAGSSHKYK